MSAQDSTLFTLCKRLIEIPSITGEGTRHIAEFCAAEILAPAGIRSRLMASDKEGPEQVNLIAFIEGRDRKATPAVLNTHLDTVPPGDPAQWTECGGKPFDASIEGDRIYGLGAADTKLDFAAKALALAGLGVPARDVWLIGTFGEEHGLIGAKEVAAARILPRGAITFIGEPSHLQVITAHKGLMAFQLELHFTPLPADRLLAARKFRFSGKAAHSSTPQLGENAIAKALSAVALRLAPSLVSPALSVVSIDGGDAVNKVPALCEVVIAADSAPDIGPEAEPVGPTRHLIPAQVIEALSRFIEALAEFAQRSGPAEPDYASPTLTCNPAIVRTHDDRITLEFELRPPPSLPLDSVRDGVNSIVQGLAAGAPGLKLELTENRSNPGFRSPAGSEAVELAMAALAQAGLPLEAGVKAGCTEAGIYGAYGLKPVVFGPGPSTGVIHAPNEYNLLSEVEAAVRFYRALLH